MAYADVSDYVGIYGTVSDEGKLRARLAASSNIIDAELSARGRSAEDVAGPLLTQVCCQMTERVMPREGSGMPTGVTSLSEMIGPYQHTYSFREPYGSPKLLDDELRLLLGDGTGARMGWAPIGGSDG